MRRDKKYLKLVLELIEESNRPIPSVPVDAVVEKACEIHGELEEVRFQVQAAILQLWHSDFINLDNARIVEGGLAAGKITRITWSGYDLLDSLRDAENQWSKG